MSSHIIYKLFNMSVLSLVISVAYCRPIHTRCNTRPHETIAKCMPCTDRCPGSPEIVSNIIIMLLDCANEPLIQSVYLNLWSTCIELVEGYFT